MAIRVGQLNAQYAADTADASDVRVTRLFAQVAIIANGATVVAASNKIFESADPTTGAFVAQAGPDYYRSISQTFGFVIDSEDDPVYNRFVGHQLFGAAGDSTADALYRAVTMTMLGVGASPDEERDVTHYLGFTDRQFQDVGHSLFRFEEPVSVSEAAEVSAINTIFSGSLANTVIEAYNISNDLGFVATAVPEYTLAIDNALNIDSTLDTTSMNFGRDEDPAQSAGGFLNQSISFTVDNNDCRSEEYAPIIGTGPNDEYDDFSTGVPSLADASGVTLTYPADGPVTYTLTLENPDFGNSHVNSFTRIDRPTRGGDRKLYADPAWATWERLEMTISGIGCGGLPTFDSVIDFLNITLGKQIRLTDWEGREWKGFIVAPETEVSEEQTGYKLTLTFEGELTTLEVTYDAFDIIHNDPGDPDVDVTYEE